jgi:predicted Rossmann fold nucleotide-binding protein DprA/Smf involved in DNA uptake
MRPLILALVSGVAVAGAAGSSASAITADVAKKCNALVAKAYPPRVPGNPAAGISKGTSQDARKYFAACVKNGGHSPNKD